MVLESVIILSIIFCIFIISFRTKQKYAFATIPLMIPPAANVLTIYFFIPMLKAISLSANFTYILMNIIAVVVSVVLILFHSKKFSTAANKYSYLTMSIIFNILLVIIFIKNYC